MIRSKAIHFFADSIYKLNKIIHNLDINLGSVTPEIKRETNLNSFSLDKSESKPTQPPKEKNKKQTNAPDANLFNGCHLVVGKVLALSHMENSDSIYCLKVDTGEEKPREIGTGLKKYLPESEFVDKKIIVFANLKPKKLGGFISNGMVLCCSEEKNGIFELVRPSDGAVPGDKVYLENSEPKEGEVPILSSNKFEKSSKFFKTDENCIAMFGDVKLRTKAGYVTVKSLKNSPIS